MAVSAEPVIGAADGGPAGSPPVAALTVDDGPNGETTSSLLDLLAELGVPAVFCLVGGNLGRRHDGLVRRMVAEGHLVANHGMTYADMGTWPPDVVERDLIAVNTLIRRALDDPGAAIPYFRAPNGSWGRTAEVACRLGLQPLGVVNTIGDWETQDEVTLTARLREAIRPGELFVVHDGGGDRRSTVAALRAVLTERLAEGWHFTLPAGSSVAGTS
ncbi:MAG: polysaccharide deacetylase family protein [Nocardioidaceae bacterium]